LKVIKLYPWIFSSDKVREKLYGDKVKDNRNMWIKAGAEVLNLAANNRANEDDSSD
jgi:hypothetical protein